MGDLRRRAAIQCNAVTIKKWGRLGFWTFTFADAVFDPDEAYARWNHFRSLCKREGLEVKGLRVYELHPGGHGIHLHFVTSVFLKHWKIQRLARMAGFGHVFVTPWEGTEELLAQYLAKYMAKAKHEDELAGRRVYATLGMRGESTRQVDIEIESPFGTFWKVLARIIPQWESMPWAEKVQAVQSLRTRWLASASETASEFAASLLDSHTTIKTETGQDGMSLLIKAENRLADYYQRRAERAEALEIYRHEQWIAWNEANNLNRRASAAA